MPLKQQLRYLPADPRLRDFALALLDLGRSTRSIEEYVRDLELFGAWLEERVDLSAPLPDHRRWAADPFTRLHAAGRDDVARFMRIMTERGLSSPTRRRRLAALRRYFDFQRRSFQREDNPARMIDQPKLPQRLPKHLELGDVDAMRNVSTSARSDFKTSRDRAIVSVFYGGGIRLSELVGLDVGDVDLEKRELNVIGKGDKQRVVLIDSVAAAALQSYLLRRGRGEDNALFLGREIAPGFRRRISRDYVRELIGAIADAAGVERHVTPHMLRHTLATRLHEEGVDLLMIRDQLGHESVATTQIYAKASLRHVRRAYDRAIEPAASEAPRDPESGPGSDK